MSRKANPPSTRTAARTPYRRAILAGVSAVTGAVAVVALAGASQPPTTLHDIARASNTAPTIPAMQSVQTHVNALAAEDAVPLARVRRSEPARPARLEPTAPTTTVTVPPATLPPTTVPPTTVPPTTVPPTTAPPPAPVYGDPYDYATWDQLASCESGGNWAIDTGNGYYGGLQFTLESWQGVGGPAGYPHQFSRETQIAMAIRLWESQGWGAWPSCSASLGYA